MKLLYLPGKILWPLLILLPIWMTTPLIERNGGLDTDGVFYVAGIKKRFAPESVRRTMTQEEEIAADMAPHCRRILTPFLVSRLPFSTITDFKALAFVSNYLSLLLLFGVLRHSGISIRGAAVGVILYAGVFWTIKFSFYSPAYIDFMMQTFLLAALYLLVRRIYWPIPLLLAVGVLQKETLLFIAPLAYIHYAAPDRWTHRNSLLYLLAVTLPPLLVLALLRSRIPAVNLYSPVDFYITMLGRQIPSLYFWLCFPLEIFSGLGILPAILLWRIREAVRFLSHQSFWTWYIVVGSVLLFGGVDKGRLFLFMLPALIVLTTHLIQPLLENPRPAVSLWLAGTLLLHLYLGHHLTPMGTYEQYLQWLVPLHAHAPVTDSYLRLGIVLLIWTALTCLLTLSDRRTAKSAEAMTV